jgi:hypothetical protein
MDITTGQQGFGSLPSRIHSRQTSALNNGKAPFASDSASQLEGQLDRANESVFIETPLDFRSRKALLDEGGTKAALIQRRDFGTPVLAPCDAQDRTCIGFAINLPAQLNSPVWHRKSAIL